MSDRKITELLGADDLPLTVLKSAAGWYLGTYSAENGPNSRESEYFRTRELAEAAYDELLEFANNFNPLPY